MRIAIPTGFDGGIVTYDGTEVNEGSISATEIDEEDIPIDELLIQDVAQYDLGKKYDSVSLSASWTYQIKSAVNRIVKNRPRYDSVERKTGVPWWVVAIFHMRESSFSLNGWLANGDPLSGPTVQVPAGLRCPGNPPWIWEDAAVVSLIHHNGTEKPELNKVGEALDYIERYNGLGYRTGAGRNTTPPSSSPYLWSGTTGYERGKYVADGKFSATAIDAQIGAAAIMKELQELGLDLGFTTNPDNPKRDEKPTVVTWFELYRLQSSGCSVIGWAGDRAVFRQDTVAVTDLKKVFDKYPGASTFRVAPEGKALPDIGPGPGPEPAPKPRVKPYIRLTKRSNSHNSHGLVPLVAEFFDNFGNKYGEVDCISGLAGAQLFRKGVDSIAGSGEPLPQGNWRVGGIEFVNGKNNYSGSWGSGLGPVWVGVEPLFRTRRSAIGFHRDDNSPGTLGCIGMANTEDLKKLVELLRRHDPKELVVDWGIA